VCDALKPSPGGPRRDGTPRKPCKDSPRGRARARRATTQL
jgi:hypothetical protein